MFTRLLPRRLMPLLLLLPLSVAASVEDAAAQLIKPSLIYKITSTSERLEMTVHTSRILTMDQKIPQAQVNNPDILELTPLSPNQIQVAAKAVGVTQVNLWGEDKRVFTVDVMVCGDAQELTMMLRATFPNAALKVTPLSNSVMISGFVDRAEHIDRIIRIAEEYYPKVINNMTVGGVQLVLLHVKVMEVSRTKLRQLGIDWANISGGNMIMQGVSGMILGPSSAALPSGVVGTSTAPAPSTVGNNPINTTLAFNIAHGNSAFFAVLSALRQDNLTKILSEPDLIAESGRPAQFLSGGKIPVPVPQSLGTISIDWQNYGTQIDFVPIVLGNGKIHLEVRPSISELDFTNSTTIAGTTVPGLTLRSAETAVEMMAGQTVAIAGLVQSRVEAGSSGLPWISEVPYVGALFRKDHESINEVESLILVTPELVEAMDPCEVPLCGPGMKTTSPTDWELFFKGHLEVPRCCPTGSPGSCPPRGDNPSGPPPDGMILGPDEKIPAPQPADAAERLMRSGTAGTAAPRQTPSGETAPEPYNRYASSKTNVSVIEVPDGPPNGPPGFIGPVGYDVVK